MSNSLVSCRLDFLPEWLSRHSTFSIRLGSLPIAQIPKQCHVMADVLHCGEWECCCILGTPAFCLRWDRERNFFKWEILENIGPLKLREVWENIRLSLKSCFVSPKESPKWRNLRFSTSDFGFATLRIAVDVLKYQKKVGSCQAAQQLGQLGQGYIKVSFEKFIIRWTQPWSKLLIPNSYQSLSDNEPTVHFAIIAFMCWRDIVKMKAENVLKMFLSEQSCRPPYFWKADPNLCTIKKRLVRSKSAILSGGPWLCLRA